ncbi:HDOD domain-containing protein [Alteromonas sediminis]|uniref:HDOD domain-containing protein n=1 Tax=Alteromonas sediminis TaxID=2259342 RepID=A0A3N5XX06_9ALTE|nr:HDOD domain-containing protein [Alteromonas sediminis]RPJ65272.1 HDOD domain-containing protein [Alteromonas sediminis]
MSINKALIEHIETLPMLPVAVTRLLALSPNDPNYFKKVLAISEDDPSLALRIIKFSNTASRVSRQPITGLKEAIIRIGINDIFSLVASMAVTKVFVPATTAEKRIWVHSLEVALLSRFIARELIKNTQLLPEHAFLTGLLHDIGLFLMFDLNKSTLEKVNCYEWATPKEHIEAEKHIYGTPHPLLGAYICKMWQVPADIIWVVKMHHDYSLAKAPKEDSANIHLLRVVQLADFVSEFIYHYQDREMLTAQAMTDAINENIILSEWLEQTGAAIDDNVMANLHSVLEIAKYKSKALGLG